ncbi:1-acyl-sn-glycerol-3-phosphate acyltransferase [Kangiella sp. HZ709]|uniref:lysophospholipid acyltransferase family protein n=1 Tax=Kangiella sp. HZ709 TaxID=2666328 RepID=UPI0012B0D313|nr:lysophospholipid acyltransferase family protein [Kangiella sp. HZ709]
MQKPVLNPSASKFRIIPILIYSFWVTFVGSIKTVFHGVFLHRNNITKSRQKIDGVTTQWGTRIINSAKVDWELIGDLESQIPKDRAVILMCNHACAYDIPLAFASIPGSIRMIAKKELFKIPILSRALKSGEFLSIDRQNRSQAIEDLKFAHEKMKSGIRIWMFPEGTRSEDGSLKPLKKGGIRLAIDTNAIIIPIVMQDIQHILPNKKWLKMRLGQKVKIKIGEAIDCKEYSSADRHNLTELVYNRMKQLLDERS